MESLAERRRRAQDIFERLNRAMPEATIELDYRTPFELLVAVVLSAQSTDKRVNLVTPELFRAFPDPSALAQATAEDVERFILTVGLYRNKARNLVQLARELNERFSGHVPKERAKLTTLPGVGAKTAGVVSMHLGGDLAFPVDTHVFRLAHRMGLARGKTPDATEAELCTLFPEERWQSGHQLLIWHGRRVCHARGPACATCVVASLCPRQGLPRLKATPAVRKPQRRARPA